MNTYLPGGCGCCGDELPADAPQPHHLDSDLDVRVCPDCRVHLRAAKALLSMPADGCGNKINLKGVYNRADAPDNLT